MRRKCFEARFIVFVFALLIPIAFLPLIRRKKMLA